MRRRSSQIAALVAILAATAGYASAAGLLSTVSGVVRDAKGTPQMGALVELMEPDSTVIAEAYTNLHGAYVFHEVAPGRYLLKATGESFLPTLRENLKIGADRKTIVNLTLNTLFEAVEWLPAERRTPGEPSDDWKWTLRSEANRPLLRFLENGPLVVVTGKDDQTGPQLEARVDVSGGARQFGQSGSRNAFEIERAGASGDHLILRVDVNPQHAENAGAVAGYERALGQGRAVRGMVAVQTMGMEGKGGEQQVHAMLLRSAESMNLGPGFTAEVGNQLAAYQGDGQQAQSLISNAPFVNVTWRSGTSTFSYHMATSPAMQSASAMADSGTLAPRFSEIGGRLRMESGLHQEIRLESDMAPVHAMFAVYRDSLSNPVVDGGGIPQAEDLAGGDLLYDPVAHVIRGAGPGYTTLGWIAEVDRRLGENSWVSVSYANGDALAAPVTGQMMTASEALRTLEVRRQQALAAAVSGKLMRTGTSWRASYRWQPAGAVTAVDPFDYAAQDAFLSLVIRQPLHCRHFLPRGTEALINVRNLLAQGYRPFLTQDGNTLYFAQAERFLQGGVSFTF